ncbi:MAG: hypothetical protein WBK77_02055 [Alphaproteobacteria bacterium]
MSGKNTELQDNGLRGLFGRLSLLDRSSLVTADLIVGLSQVARRDTEKHPLRYPVYASGFTAVFMGAMVPCPPPIMEAVPLACLAAWVNVFYPKGKSRLSEAFNGESLVKRYGKRYITDAPGNDDADTAGIPKLKTYRILSDAIKKAHKNMNVAHDCFMDYLKKDPA